MSKTHDDRCTCEWADDVGDPEVGPDPYIARLDEGCPQHGQQAVEAAAADDRWDLVEELLEVRPDGPETARGGLIGQQPY